MGKKGKWYSSIKKALSPMSSSKKNHEKRRFKNDQTTDVADPVTKIYMPPSEEIETCQSNVNEQSNTIIVENATDRDVTVADEVVTSHVAPPSEEVIAVSVKRYGGKSVEEVAAIKIQTVFRGYLARRALRGLRGLVRLNQLVQGPVAKRQATNTLKCMQTLSRVQSQIRSRRVRMSEENEALQRQLLQKHVKELEKVQMSDEWNDSARSKEEVESKLVNKHEAAMRRERALAYAFSHQQTWKNTAKTPNTMFMNPTNPSWGWSWLERLMSAKPWEHGEKEHEQLLQHDQSSVKNSTVGEEIKKSYARHQLSLHNSSPRLSSSGNKPTHRKTISIDDLNKSNRSRRHSYAGSSVNDDVVSLVSSPSLPSYMVATQSAKAKLRVVSPVGLISNAASSPVRLRRHSGPPKMESRIIVEQVSVIGVES